MSEVLPVIDYQMTFGPKALAIIRSAQFMSLTRDGSRHTLNKLPTVSSGAGAKAPLIYVYYHPVTLTSVPTSKSSANIQVDHSVYNLIDPSKRR